MIVAVADTSGLLAAVDDCDPGQAHAKHVIDTAGALIVSPVLLAEVDHVGRRPARPGAPDAILTLDHRDLRAIRPLAAFDAFRALPDDL